MQLSFLDKTVLNLILHLYFLTKNVIHACFTTMRCFGNKPVKISYWARTTVTFPIDDHYNILAPTLKIYPTIFFLNSQKMTDPLRHLVCEIRENDTSFSHKLLQSMRPVHFCHEIPRFLKYEYILPYSHCVITQLVYILTNGIISKLRCYCAQKRGH